MKKVFLAAAFVVAGVIGANAQKGNNQIGVGADLGFPTGDFGEAFKTGFGGYAKGLFGIGTAGQVTLTTGFQSFKAKGSTDDESASWRIIPFLVGYRHNFSGFYVEPALGYSSNSLKIEFMGESESESEGMFTWSAGAGYVVSGFDIGVRYQSMSKDGDSFSLFGVRVGYNFSLGGGSAKK